MSHPRTKHPGLALPNTTPDQTGASERPPLWKAWLISARPQTLTACAAPVVVGSALAAAGPGWRPELALVALLAAGGIQIGTNFVNDAADAAKGADDGERIGPPRAVAEGWLSPRAVWLGAALSFGIALALGGVLIANCGWPLLAIGLSSIAAGYAYTAGPFPLAYLGLGDVFVVGFFGLVATLGTFYVHTGHLSWPGALAGLGLGLLATAILVANNLRDRSGDARANKRTLVVRFGEGFGRWEYALCVLLPFALLPIPPLVDAGGWGWLLPVAILPWALKSAHSVLRRRPADSPGAGDYAEDGVDLIPRLVEAARMQLVYALLLGAGVTLWN